MSYDYDVIVIGAGGAGLAAAAEAASAGARTLIVEADRKVGGSTAMSGGVVWASQTSVQRQAGIADDAAAQFRYYMNLNQHKLEAALVHRLCYDSAAAVEWLIELGVSFPQSNLYVSGVDGIARGHRAAGHGAEITAALENALAGKSVEIALNTRVAKLHQDASGAVIGIEAEGEQVTANATVIATGGFGNNPALLKELYPDATQHAALGWYIGSKFSRGDGLDLGRATGADMSGHNTGLLLLTPGFAKELEVYLPPWLLYVNQQGRRFINESTEYSVLATVVKHQTGGECYAIFDEAARAASQSSTAPNWSAERLAHFAASGSLVRAGSIDELAGRLGVRATTLATTVANYNQYCRAGQDASFFKAANHLKPISTAPYYAARIRPAIVCWTGAGLRIDREARALNHADQPIAGLYAAGETTGGAFGECYAGGGASILNALVFGRVAGRNASDLRHS